MAQRTPRKKASYGSEENYAQSNLDVPPVHGLRGFGTEARKLLGNQVLRHSWVDAGPGLGGREPAVFLFLSPPASLIWERRDVRLGCRWEGWDSKAEAECRKDEGSKEDNGGQERRDSFSWVTVGTLHQGTDL